MMVLFNEFVCDLLLSFFRNASKIGVKAIAKAFFVAGELEVNIREM
jgi:hypothetical protein